MIKIIAACSSNNVIGSKNTLLWKVPGDLKRFKELTTGEVVVMGRKTYESIGKPLPNRTNVIITRNPEYKVEGCVILPGIKEAMDLYDDMYVIGGGEIYTQFLPFADIIELTYIDKEYNGDAYFPEIPKSFIEVKREDNECKDFKFSYITYYSYTLNSKDILNEGWTLSGVAMNGGSKHFIKDEYMLTFNGENKLYIKEHNGLIPRVQIVKVSNGKKNKTLFDGDVFNKVQLKDTLDLISK
jgi:dihydrofolate reductase